MAWTPPSDAVATSSTGWTPPSDAVEAVNSDKKTMASEAKRAMEAPLIDPAGLLETAATMGSGIFSSAVGGVAGLGTLLGTGDNQKATDVIRSLQERFTYQPRSESGKRGVEALNLPFDVAREGTKYVGGKVGKLAGNELAGEAIGEIVPDVAATLLMGRSALKNAPKQLPNVLQNARETGQRAYTPIEAAKSSKAIEKAQQNAQVIEAAKDANDLGIKINPAEANPTKANQLKSTLAGGKPAMDAATALENLKVNVPRIVTKELNLPEGTIFKPEVFDNVLAEAGKPALQIRTLGTMVDDGAVTQALNNLRGQSIIGKGESRKAINGLVDEAIEAVNKGMTGDEIISNIQQHRADARKALKNEQLSVVERDKAKASIGVANALEQLVEQNLQKAGNVELLNAYREGRQLQAKAYTWKDSWDANTGIFDPQVIAKQTAGDTAISGDTLKVGKIAGNFQGSMSKPTAGAVEKAIDLVKTHVTRSSPSAVVGLTAGSLLGNPLLGGVIGTAVGEMLAPIMQSRILKNQKSAIPANSSLSSPVDFSSSKPGTAMVVAPEVVGPAETVSSPNWTYGRPDVQVTPTPADLSTPQLGYNPNASGQLGALRMEDARVRAQSMAEGQAAEAAAKAAEANRAPTGTGTLYDLDPITGRLVPASQGVKGATPEVFMESTGKALKSASEKIAANKSFDLTAAEKVAWDKTAVDIQAVLPEFKLLSPQEISAKMADRAWVRSTVDKIQQKEKMFAEIEQRAADNASKNLAAIKREQLNDILSTLEESLGPRPVAKNIQGKKTREFNKNRYNGLTP